MTARVPKLGHAMIKMILDRARPSDGLVAIARRSASSASTAAPQLSDGIVATLRQAIEGPLLSDALSYHVPLQPHDAVELSAFCRSFAAEFRAGHQSRRVLFAAADALDAVG
jgi:hypothetical protein